MNNYKYILLLQYDQIEHSFRLYVILHKLRVIALFKLFYTCIIFYNKIWKNVIIKYIEKQK